MINPYFCYALSFAAALIVYSFGWSGLYPEISWSLLLFIGCTVILFALAGVIMMKSRAITFIKLDASDHTFPVLITLFIYLLWSAEFAYEGGIPLAKILLGEPYNYMLFGIPSLHVFVVTFSSFYTLYLFHLFLSGKSRLILLLYGLNLMAALLIYNRGMMFFNLAGSAFMLSFYRPGISATRVSIGLAAAVLLLYAFGVLGSLRVSRLAGEAYSNERFLNTGKATPSFRSSVVPDEVFWAYIYISSPLANLQNNISTFEAPPPTPARIAEWINNEILFDFVSKRVNALAGISRVPENTIGGPFNASTVYSRSYSYLEWPGLLLMCAVLALVPVMMARILPPGSPFFLTGMATLNTIFLFMVFENTLRFTGLSFQLVYPVLLHFVLKRFPRAKIFFVNKKVTSG